MAVALTGKVAVITGAGTGIGARTALRLAEAGADVFLHHHGPLDEVEAVASQCRAAGRRAEVAGGDFALDPGVAAHVVDQALAQLGRVDILVNNAGLTSTSEPFETHRRDTFERTLAVNVIAAFLAAQAAARHMIAQASGGRIINIGSVHARQSAPQRVAYEVSKGALHALTYSAAVQLGQHGITVNCVAPGAIWVERYAALESFDEAWYVSRTPVGRMGRPDDIASAVVFLASDEASFISGETLFVDGGMTRRMPLVK